MQIETREDALTEALARLKSAHDDRQDRLAAEIGIDQGSLSRVMAGGRFGRKIGNAIVERFPELRAAVADALLRR